jgi:predicted HNH restriction endonuclease
LVKDKGNIIKIMAQLNRKVVPLCSTCHDKVHAGKYDGISLRELLALQKKD